MEKLFILKLGGSVITDKAQRTSTFKHDLITDIFVELKESLSNEPDVKLIIVHGAGGHIHHLAHTYNLQQGTGDDADALAKSQEVHNQVLTLTNNIAAVAENIGLSVRAIETSTIISQTNKKEVHCDLHPIQQSIEAGYIPILGGDMVPDSVVGHSICSGDAITATLVHSLPIVKAFFASDIDGIYTVDPYKDPAATLIESITLRDVHKVAKLTHSHNADTTGGLQGKIAACKDLFDTSKTLEEIHIFNGTKGENFGSIIQSRPLPHTIITQ